MEIKIAKNNFLNLPKKFSNWQDSKIVVVPFSLESSVSYGTGTRKGPRAIIKASHEVELFDEELKKETYKEKPIATLEEFFIKKNIDQALEQLEKVVSKIIIAKKFPIILGGEHTLTRAPINFFKEKFNEITILQFDAHADLRDSLGGDKNSHAAVMRRCLELSNKIKLVQVGIRNISNEKRDGSEYNFWQKNQSRIKTFWAKDQDQWQINEIIDKCGPNVYLTFDVDVFDSSIAFSTGTPEPGGLDWYKVLKIIKALSLKRKIIGADFVELAPIKNLHAPDFMLAKLIYKFASYLFLN